MESDTGPRAGSHSGVRFGCFRSLASVSVAPTAHGLNPSPRRAQLAADLLDVDIHSPLLDHRADRLLDQLRSAEHAVRLFHEHRDEAKLRGREDDLAVS